MIFGSPDAFQWDLDKAELNLQKHHLAFEDAVRVFEGPTLDSLTLRRGELRVVSIGVVEEIEVTVVYVVRGRTFRIISARKASKDERKAYRELLSR
jgi:uncharacterized DUF497 family protein